MGKGLRLLDNSATRPIEERTGHFLYDVRDGCPTAAVQWFALRRHRR